MYDKYIEFLKKYELYDQDVFDYISTRMIIVDYKHPDAKNLIGCFPIVRCGFVDDIRLCVPKIVDDISLSMNIHEYLHLLSTYKKLGKEYKEDKYDELLPVLFEFIYLSDNNPEYLEERKKYVLSCRDSNLKKLITTFEEREKEKVLFKKV